MPVYQKWGGVYKICSVVSCRLKMPVFEFCFSLSLVYTVFSFMTQTREIMDENSLIVIGLSVRCFKKISVIIVFIVCTYFR